MTREEELAARIQELEQENQKDKSLIKDLYNSIENVKVILKKYEELQKNLQIQEAHMAQVLHYTRNWDKFDAVNALLEDEKSKKILRYRFLRVAMCDFDASMELLEEIAEECSVDGGGYYLTPTGEDYPVMFDKNQYYPEGVMELSRDEVFLDAGAYLGESIEDFIVRTNENFRAIYAFEPSKANYKELMKNMGQKISDDRIHIFNCGLSNKSETLYFDINTSSSAMGSKELGEETEACEVKPINEVLTEEECNALTFIKMDIEGAEMQALQSLEKYIAAGSPKLAISVYHKPEDIWEIPLYIHGINPNYRFYLRHHSNGPGDTVLYAMPISI